MRLYRLPKAEGIDDLTLTEAATPAPGRDHTELARVSERLAGAALPAPPGTEERA